MRSLWAFLIALLVAVPALTPACAKAPHADAAMAMHHHRMPADCHHDSDGTERCIGCGMAAIPAPDAALETPALAPAMPPTARLATLLAATHPPVTDPPPRTLG